MLTKLAARILPILDAEIGGTLQLRYTLQTECGDGWAMGSNDIARFKIGELGVLPVIDADSDDPATVSNVVIEDRGDGNAVPPEGAILLVTILKADTALLVEGVDYQRQIGVTFMPSEEYAVAAYGPLAAVPITTGDTGA